MTPTTAPTPTVSRVPYVGVSAARPVLVALDIDGTLTTAGSLTVPAPTVDAVRAVREAGHHVVLASGRSWAGVQPIADVLDLDGWVVASSGAVIARRTPAGPAAPARHSFEASDVRQLDVRQVVKAALDVAGPGLMIAVEELGHGYYVSRQFPVGELRGSQTVLPFYELGSLASPRIVLRAPDAHELIAPLRALGLTVNPGASDELVDVTPRAVSKASALETVRRRLRVERAHTMAVGDGVNDLEALDWAAWGVAMGHAPAAVRDAADYVTGTLAGLGAATVLEVLAELSAGGAEQS